MMNENMEHDTGLTFRQLHEQLPMMSRSTLHRRIRLLASRDQLRTWYAFGNWRDRLYHPDTVQQIRDLETRD